MKFQEYQEGLIKRNKFLFTGGGLALNIENEIFDRINKIEWFNNCGKVIPIDFSYEVKFINGWDVAKKYYNQPIWEDVTLEAKNRLTIFLNDKYRREYSNWNILTAEARNYLNKEVVPKLEPVITKNNLDNSIVSTVTWDILVAIMEYAYRGCKNRPIFFLDLLAIYEKGNFPCGWEGNWSNGKLIVY